MASGSSTLEPPAKRKKLDSPMAEAKYPCLVCKKPFRRCQNLLRHLTTKEKGINVFVCVGCGQGFCKEGQLRMHGCEADMSNNQNTALSVLCHVVVCEECGLFTGLVNEENPSWASYSSLCAHPSRSFRKITLYTWKPDAVRFVNNLENPFNVRIGGGDLLDFLKNHVDDEPFVEKAAITRLARTYYKCDLCAKNFLGSEFNNHDCVVSYMRRYLLDGKVIFCPGVNLMECKVDMSIQDPITEKIQRNLELCLRFLVPIVAPKVDDFKADGVYSCKHCERIIISPALFREHIVEAFQEKKIDFEWPKTTNDLDLLSHFGDPVTIDSTGFMCPKAGCSEIRCSPVGLELHIRNDHQDMFEQLAIPDFVTVAEAEIEPSVDMFEQLAIPDFVTASGNNVDVIADHRYQQPAADMTVAEAEIVPIVVQVDSSDDSIVAVEMKPAKSLMDEDIQVIESSESRPSTSTSGTVSGPGSAGRRATYPCGHCSRMFFTQRAAEEHRQEHKNDAGVITEEVLPVPTNTNVYICRLCCLAFEMRTEYAEHMEKHKRVIECSMCSAVCLNPEYLASHMKSHQTKDLFFGCPHCLKAFRSEVALLIHMNGQHRLPLLWHCHKCGMANSEWNRMSSHICQPHLPVIVRPISKKKLHFQPSRIDQPRGESTSKAMDVAECVHRSCLAGNGNLIACPQCGTFISKDVYEASIKSNKLLIVVTAATERQVINSHPCTRMMPTVVNQLSLPPPNIPTILRPNQPPLVVIRNRIN